MHRLILALVLSASQLTAWADPAATTHVVVTGQGVGIAQMNGGTVQVGPTPEEVAMLARVTDEELVRQLTQTLPRILTQQEWVYRQSVSIGVVEGFLANVKGRRIPQDEWPQAFAELSQQLLQLSVSNRDSASGASTRTTTSVTYISQSRSSSTEEVVCHAPALGVPPFSDVIPCFALYGSSAEATQSRQSL